MIGNVVSSLVGNAGAKKQNNRTMAFNASEAEKNRLFQSKEAEIARDFQQNFYERYQSPQAMIRQGQEAGIHPYAMLGISPSSGPSGTSTLSGSQATSGQQFSEVSSAMDIVRSLLDYKALKSQIDVNESVADKNNAEAESVRTDTQFKPDLFNMQLRSGEVNMNYMLAGINELNSRSDYQKDMILSNYVDRQLKQSSIKEIIARTDKTVMETVTEKLRQNNIRMTDRHIAEQILSLQAERSLTVAKAITEKNQGELVSAKVFQEKFDNEYRKMYNQQPPSGELGNIINFFRGIAGNFRYYTRLKNLID